TPPGPTQGSPAGEAASKSLFQKPSLDDMGPGTDVARPLGRNDAQEETSYFRKNSLDEMTVGRTEKPVDRRQETRAETDSAPKRFPHPSAGDAAAGDGPGPTRRGEIGVGSYEDPAEQKRKGRTKG